MDSGAQGGAESGPATPAAAPSPPANGAGGSSWIDKAAQAADLQTSQPSLNATIPENGTPRQGAPTVITPLPHSGVRGFIDKALDSLAGTNRLQIYTDESGQKYIQKPNMTRGQQWLKLGVEGATGAAAGLAAGKGAGNMGRAAEAGVQQGEKIGQEQKQNLRSAQVEVANSQILAHQLAEQAFTMGRLKVKASREDMDYSQGQLDNALKPQPDGGPGGTLMGTATDLGAAARLLKESPEVMEAQVKRGDVRTVPNYDADGNPAGFHIVMMPPGWGEEVLPPGSAFTVAVPDPKTPGLFIRQEQKSSEPMTLRQQTQYNDAATSKIQAAALVKHTADLKLQTEGDEHQKAADAHSKELREEQDQPLAEAHTRAQTDAETAAAARSRAATQAQANDNTDLVHALVTGNIAPDRLGYLLGRKDGQALLSAAVKEDPNLDSSRLAAYPKVYEQFTSTKPGTAGAQLNAGATAIKHLKDLKALDTNESAIYGTNDYTKYHNLLDTVVSELGKFYGNDTIPALEGYRKTLGAIRPSNRAVAIAEQAQAMGKKFDSYEKQWKNAAPSPSYEAPMPQIDDEAKGARAELDPKYKDRYVAEQQAAQKAALASPPPAAQPGIGKSISLDAARALPQFRGQSDAQIAAAAKALGYTVNPVTPQ
jgi:hypothetical protein